MKVTLRINGTVHDVDVAPAQTLLSVLRDTLDLGNAIFDATGVRLRALPLIPRGLPTSTNQL